MAKKLSPTAVEHILDDIGIDEDSSEKCVKNASREFALRTIRLCPSDEFIMKKVDIEVAINYFSIGYEQALVDLGLREPDNCGTYKRKG